MARSTEGAVSMGRSEYIRSIRSKIGHILLQLPSVTIINYSRQSRVLAGEFRFLGLTPRENMQAVIEVCRRGDLQAKPRVVISNNS